MGQNDQPQPETEPPVAEARPKRVVPWWEHALIVGIAVSLFIHLFLALMTALVLYDRPESADAGEGDAIQLAVMDETELTELSAMISGGGQEFATELLEDPVTFEITDLNSPLTEIDDFTNDTNLVTGLTGAGDTSAGQDSNGMGDIALSSAVGGAKFFGVEASGSRFAYIVDVSGSMNGPRIDALKQALGASVVELTQDARFAIVLYSRNADPLTGKNWVRAGDRQRSEARRKIQTIQAYGDTNPVPAFDIVLRLKPLPDAIYFMTDGQFNAPVEEALLVTVGRMVRSDEGVPIHCITFIERGAERLMRRIARQTGGSYTHISGGQP